MHWRWGWTPVAYPWYGYYGYYFAPYPVYPSAAFWLTDYLIAANLEAAYAARADTASQDDTGSQGQPIRQDDSTPPPTQQTVTLSPEVKQAIAEEVKAQIAAEQNAVGQNSTPGGGSTTAANGEVPPALDPARRTFVVSDSLDVVADDQECALTPGDVITRLTDTP